MPPKNPDRNPGGSKVNDSNSETQVQRGNKPNPGRRVQRGKRPNPGMQVERGRTGFRISKKMVLWLAGIAAALALLGGCEYQVRQENKAVTEELLRGTKFNGEIRGIKIYVDNSSMLENGPLLEELINSLEPIISILPDEMVRRIRFIRLDAFVDNSTTDPFEAVARIDIEGMRLVAYPNNFKNGISPEIEDSLAEALIHEGVHLSSYGNPYGFLKGFLRSLRKHELERNQCKISVEICIRGLTDLIDSQSLEDWRRISRQNGGYVSTDRINPGQIRPADLIEKPNFGYILNNPKLRYGRLNIAEDIACVFEKILSSLYKVIYRNENPKEVIIALLSKTPGETGLYRKYQIACKSLIKWYQEGSRQHGILTEFIKIIEDAIKEAEGTTGGQGRSIESLRRRLAEIREAGRTANGQGTSVESIIERRPGPGRIPKNQIVEALKQTQIIGDAIKPGGTTGGQGRSIESLRRRLAKKSGGRGLS